MEQYRLLAECLLPEHMLVCFVFVFVFVVFFVVFMFAAADGLMKETIT